MEGPIANAAKDELKRTRRLVTALMVISGLVLAVVAGRFVELDARPFVNMDFFDVPLAIFAGCVIVIGALSWMRTESLRTGWTCLASLFVLVLVSANLRVWIAAAAGTVISAVCAAKLIQVRRALPVLRELDRLKELRVGRAVLQTLPTLRF